MVPFVKLFFFGIAPLRLTIGGDRPLTPYDIQRPNRLVIKLQTRSLEYAQNRYIVDEIWRLRARYHLLIGMEPVNFAVYFPYYAVGGGLLGVNNELVKKECRRSVLVTVAGCKDAREIS